MATARKRPSTLEVGTPAGEMNTLLILSNGDLIGHALVNGADPSMGVLICKFEPTPPYEEVKWIFEDFAAKLIIPQTLGQPIPAEVGTPEDEHRYLESYYNSKNKLNLEVTMLDGTPIKSDNIHLVDLRKDLGEIELYIYTDSETAIGLYC